ncbi:MAG TPA: G1 family glutamic endopeptidase, partial [Candidatus Paceibacterota bacterium]|nr:G1 family glutamic endopeptidase [Candidatus Paceibacterota bacterium]
MNSVPALRFMALAVLSGALAALVLGGWAFAQNIPLPAPLPNTGPAPATNTAPDSALAPAGSSNTNALNWAGYVATGGTYTSVSGTWTVPKVQDGTTGDVADATWVGIGGVASTDLIQAGTEAIPDSSGGIVYQAWMELLPQDSKVVPLAVSPGDVVSVSITEGSPGVWEVSFNDATSGKSFQTAVRYD